MGRDASIKATNCHANLFSRLQDAASCPYSAAAATLEGQGSRAQAPPMGIPEATGLALEVPDD